MIDAAAAQADGRRPGAATRRLASSRSCRRSASTRRALARECDLDDSTERPGIARTSPPTDGLWEPGRSLARRRDVSESASDWLRASAVFDRAGRDLESTGHRASSDVRRGAARAGRVADVASQVVAPVRHSRATRGASRAVTSAVRQVFRGPLATTSEACSTRCLSEQRPASGVLESSSGSLVVMGSRHGCCSTRPTPTSPARAQPG